ncbi:MAG: hypothetical protein JNK82_39645 [Myxococcaceae bacterium]|nr:hypothetical protein [Myxococcaceae bacterium]
MSEVHSSTFDAGSLQWIDETDGRTTVRTYPSVDEFIDEGLFLEAGGGPTEQLVTVPPLTMRTLYSYDVLRRRTGWETKIRAEPYGVGIRRETYAAWDAMGRPTTGNADMLFSALPHSYCTNKTLRIEYDGGSRVSIKTYQGGQNSPADEPPVDWCGRTDRRLIVTYDARFMPLHAVNQTDAGTIVESWNVIATADVCR